MARKLVGKSALVTEGRQGIGLGIVTAFLAEGAEVVSCGRGPRPAHLPDACGWVRADVADPAQTGALSAACPAADIVVNNAGVQVERTVTDTTEADWDAVIGTHCRGLFNVCRAFIPLMPPGGAIINIGSVSGIQADAGMALYNASKAFVHGRAHAIAVDPGPRAVTPAHAIPPDVSACRRISRRWPSGLPRKRPASRPGSFSSSMAG